jgi:hypothetical protein
MFFFVVWGKKQVRRSMGYVADFCPACRDPRPFRVGRVAIASHVFYIPLREERLMAHYRICTDCGVQLKANLETYESISKRKADFEALCERTNSKLLDACAKRLVAEKEAELSTDISTIEARAAKIQRYFMVMSPLVEQRFSSIRLDKETWVTVAATAMAMFVSRPLVESLAPERVSSVFESLFVVGASGILWMFLTASRRFMTRKVVPPLSKSLQPLQPSLSEIKAVLSELKNMRYKIGSKLHAEELLNAIRAI